MRVRLPFFALLGFLAGCAGPAGGVAEQDAANPNVYLCARAAGSIAIDGALDEQVWQQAAWLELTHPLGASAAGLEPTQAAVLWDDLYLYVAARVTDSHIEAQCQGRDARVWREDCVEIFLAPMASLRVYYEIDTSASGAFFDSTDLRDLGPAPLTVIDAWNPESLEIRTRSVPGGWQLEGRVRLDSMPTAKHVPPLPGDAWGMNVYRVNRLANGRQIPSAWNPTPGFHEPARFGRLRFVFPERQAEQAMRRERAEIFLASTEGKTRPALAVGSAGLAIRYLDGEDFTYDPARQTYSATADKASLARVQDPTVPGELLAQVERRPLEIRWSLAAPGQILLLARLSDKGTAALEQGKADGVRLRLFLPGQAQPVEFPVNSSAWELSTLEAPAAGQIRLVVDCGPAGNDLLDRFHLSIYGP